MASARFVRRALPLRAYLVGIVALFVLAAATGAIDGWLQAERDATRDAATDAAFGARLAASELATTVAVAVATVQQVAATPSLTQGPCSLAFALDGGPDAGHLDIVRPDGTVTCSSRKGPGGYAGASWLAAAAQAPTSAAPVPDPRAGGQAVLLTAPVPGVGMAAVFINLSILGPSLAQRFGGPRHLELLITTADAGTVLSRSLDASRWAGAAVSGTPFRAGGGTHADVTGRARVYGEATVPELGWRVFAGADRAQALATARRLAERQAAVIAAGLLVALAATLIVYRRITLPIGRLGAAVHAHAVDRSGGGGAVPVAGPAEVEHLGREFNGLLAAVDHELDQRRRAEETALELERNYRQLFDSNPFPTFVFDAESLALLDVNGAALAHYGYSRAEFLARTLTDLGLPEDAGAVAQALTNASTVDHFGPLRHTKADGAVIEVNIISHALSFGGRKVRCAVIEDVSAKEQLEGRLRQSQRLESLGQLAGGVAHDFNNLLNVIVGYAGLAAGELAEAAESDPRWQPVHDDLKQVIVAVDRATALTRQLLAFARAEVVKPRVLDLNTVVAEVEQLLRRTLGEDVRLVTRRADGLPPVCADPGQLEQVLVNLAVNARDAMPDGGTLAIETDEVTLDEHYAAQHPGARPGGYVRLRVSDTGSGMSKDTVDRAFEPFFTTKPKGQGTGLGLATIYGIVTKAGGHVQIYSELGTGTTITVLLPAAEAPLVEHVAPVAVPRPGRGETILLVEDEDSLRAVTERILVRAGYRVLTAADGPTAVTVASHHDRIDLLLTDVVMPHMPGTELALHLCAQRPGLPVVYLSGYAEPILNARSDLPAGVTLLTKPVTEQDLLLVIGETLLAREQQAGEQALDLSS